jgi:hypothetical protein
MPAMAADAAVIMMPSPAPFALVETPVAVAPLYPAIPLAATPEAARAASIAVKAGFIVAAAPDETAAAVTVSAEASAATTIASTAEKVAAAGTSASSVEAATSAAATEAPASAAVSTEAAATAAASTAEATASTATSVEAAASAATSAAEATATTTASSATATAELPSLNGLGERRLVDGREGIGELRGSRRIRVCRPEKRERARHGQSHWHTAWHQILPSLYLAFYRFVKTTLKVGISFALPTIGCALSHMGWVCRDQKTVGCAGLTVLN